MLFGRNIIFVDLVLVMFYFVPLSAYNGIDHEYYKRGNRFNMLKSLYPFISTNNLIDLLI